MRQLDGWINGQMLKIGRKDEQFVKKEGRKGGEHTFTFIVLFIFSFIVFLSVQFRKYSMPTFLCVICIQKRQQALCSLLSCKSCVFWRADLILGAKDTAASKTDKIDCPHEVSFQLEKNRNKICSTSVNDACCEEIQNRKGEEPVVFTQ